MEMTTKDCVKKAILDTQEMVRDFNMYANEVEGDDLKKCFKEFAKEQGLQARRLQDELELLS